MVKFNHFNFNVLSVDKSIEFYKKTLGLEIVREHNAKDGSFRIVFLGDGSSDFSLELTEMTGRTEPYDVGEQEYHLAFITDEYEEFYKRHAEMGVICYENKGMGIYFMEDPDGYWIEIVPVRK